MEEVMELVKEGSMPLKSYTWIHKNAKLTQAERTALIDWADSVQKSLGFPASN
jgi:hypothetical protein